MIIELNKYYFNKCATFAENQIKGSERLYSFRGEHRKDKIRADIVIGKMGEVAAYKYLKKKGYQCNKPDFTIYERINKSFAADLVTDCGKQIHVKSQGFDSMMRYGASWLLQKSDKITTKPGEEEYILMVSLKGLEADVLGTVRIKDLVDYKLFEEPKVARYGRTKKALYFDSMRQSGIDLTSL